MSKTKTVQTPYGDASIEVVECDSCGAEMSKDDARVFVTGNYVRSRNGGLIVNGSVQEGYICEHCDDAGPISYPGASLVERVWSTIPKWDGDIIDLAFVLVALLVGIIIFTMLFALLYDLLTVVF